MPYSHALWSALTLLLLRGQNDSQTSKHSCGLFLLLSHLSAEDSLVSSELWSKASSNPSRFTFYPSELVTSLKTYHGQLGPLQVSFLCSQLIPKSLFQTALFLPIHTLTICINDKLLSYSELQLFLCILQYEGHPFFIFCLFFFFSLYLHNNVSA